MTAPTLQLPRDPLRNHLTPAERAASEAVAERQAVDLAAHALPARPCRCGSRAWGDAGHCQRCGHDRGEAR